MAKRRSWMDRLKKMLSTESESKQEKKERRKRRWLFGRLKKHSPALPPPPPPPPLPLRLRSLREAEKAQSERAVAAAVATAAAAEAALAAAQAAAQVVRLTGNCSSCSVRKTREIAAMKIQAAFRGYLARRALRALKGLVKLQALIRGQAVRHQTNVALRGLNSLMKIQSQARLNRMKPASNHHSHQAEDVLHAKAFRDKETGHAQAQHSDRTWNGSILSKEEIISLLRKRQEATFKRERAMDYAFTHQEWKHLHAATLTTLRESQPRDKDIHKALPMQCPQDRILQNEPLHALESPGFISCDQKAKAEDEYELMYQARRSFNWSERAHSKDDDFFSLCSPLRPSYMASTASTKAKFRSASTPKQRPGTINSSDDFSFDKEKLFSPLALVKTFSKHQELAKQRGKDGPTKHLSFDSEPPYLLGWEKSGPFR